MPKKLHWLLITLTVEHRPAGKILGWPITDICSPLCLTYSWKVGFTLFGRWALALTDNGAAGLHTSTDGEYKLGSTLPSGMFWEIFQPAGSLPYHPAVVVQCRDDYVNIPTRDGDVSYSKLYWREYGVRQESKRFVHWSNNSYLYIDESVVYNFSVIYVKMRNWDELLLVFIK